MIETIRGRLTAWYVAVLALTLVAFELAVYAVLARTLHQRIDESLLAAIDTTTISLSNDLAEGQSRNGAARATVDELSTRQIAVAVFDRDGLLMAAPEGMDDTPRTIDADHAAGEEPQSFDSGSGDDRVRVAVKRVSLAQDPTPFIVHVSTPLEPLDDELEDIRAALLSSIPVVLLVAGAGGWFLARKGLQPVGDMADRARQIGASNLDLRLPVGSGRDELARLAGAFNELLERVGAAFAQQRQFMADASHELKTPLATIRAATSVTLQRTTRDEAEYRDAMRIIDEQAVRLSRLVDDMFTLALADADHWPVNRTSFYLDELLQAVAAAATLRGGATHRRIDVTGLTDVTCVADEDLIRRLVGNLVDNAIKYSPPGTPVVISLERAAAMLRITVTDQGPGIDRAAQPHVFERFFRAEKSRARSNTTLTGGGLGLAIALWIARAHGGNLELVKSDATGSTFAAELPCGRDS